MGMTTREKNVDGKVLIVSVRTFGLRVPSKPACESMAVKSCGLNVGSLRSRILSERGRFPGVLMKKDHVVCPRGYQGKPG